jgi:pimeloyl-ACP methyl ester carboxylesterase
MRVFLLHGMGRTPASMWLLAWRLRQAGHLPSLFGYAVTLTPLPEIVDKLKAHVLGRLAADKEEGLAVGEDPEPYAVIGHSLGNLLTRLASPELPAGFCRFVQLAPPNHSPASARLLRDQKLFQAITQDAGRKLVDESFFDEVPVPAVPTLIVAGDAGPRQAFLPPFRGEPNDGILSVEETRLPGIAHLVLPAIHTFIMNRRDATRAILAFLEEAEEEAARRAAASDHQPAALLKSEAP